MIANEIKLCGTTSESDLLIAARARATTAGLICEPPCKTAAGQTIALEDAVQLAESAARYDIKAVLLPRTTDIAELVDMVEAVRPSRVQLGESEEPALAEALREIPHLSEIAIAQVIHVSGGTGPDVIDPFLDWADIIHLDTASGQAGGSGQTHDWDISREITRYAHSKKKPVILAGGLTPENVPEAIEKVRPDGVDVQTGIKKGDEHDRQLAEEFVRNARTAFSLQGIRRAG